MANQTLGLSTELHEYVVEVGVREPAVLRRLREETAELAEHEMQIAPEQGALLSMLVELTGARRCIEVGTFTGYSAAVMALALPDDGTLLCCDVSTEWTDVARRYWDEAGVTAKIELRIAPAAETLDELLESGGRSSYDLAFVDADKTGYAAYYERLVELMRPGGLIVFDNMLMSGQVLDPSADDENALAIASLNQDLAADSRVSICLVPVGDGFTLARKR